MVFWYNYVMNSNLNIHNNYTTKQLRLPLDLEIKIPFDSEVRTFDEVFKRLKLERYLISQKDNRGRVGYNPVKMLKLVLFCQMEKIQSLRAMEKAAKNDIRIMWLTDEMKPSHQAIKNFLDSYLVKNIEDIFYEITNFLITKEKIDTEKLYIDGTKIESMANKYTFVWRGSVEKFQIKLYKKISKYLESLNQRYELENIYFPIYTEYNVDYLSKVHQFINDQVKRSNITFTYGKGNRKTALQRDFEKIDEYLSKLIEYENHLKIMGTNRNSYSKTDHDATFMRMKEDYMKNDQLKPGYNIQIGISDEYIIHLDIFNDRNDYKTLIPFLEGYYKRYNKYPKYPVADAGYGGLTNYRYLKTNDMELYQKYNMYVKDTTDKKRVNDYYNGLNIKTDEDGDVISKTGSKLEYIYTRKNGSQVYYIKEENRTVDLNKENISYQKEVINNLQSDLGIELRDQRSIQAEGAFGVIKDPFKTRRFRRRGTQNVRLEFFLVAIGYNLSKYHNKKYRIIN